MALSPNHHSQQPNPPGDPFPTASHKLREMKSVQQKRVQSLHIIYDADGTPTGELLYLLKKLLGLSHCAACTITHGARCEKPEFTALKHAWPVPVRNIHRDEMDDMMRGAVAGVLPCVVARTDAGDVRVMGPVELERCEGEVLAFEKSVLECVGRWGLCMWERQGGDDGEQAVVPEGVEC